MRIIYSDHVCADECIHRIPLIVRWPGVARKNATVDSLLYNVDLAPTLCDLLGAPVVPDWDGSSFRANLEGRPRLERDCLVWDTGLYTVQRAVRTKTHLMIRTYDNYGYRFEPVELYDMVADPYQTHNLAAEQPDLVLQHSGLMAQWLQEQRMKGHNIPDPLEEILRERDEFEQTLSTPEALRRLKG